jgi:predicted RNA-binding Zn ribbon-like protein
VAFTGYIEIVPRAELNALMADKLKPFKWLGGSYCLDFNNTVDWDGSDPPNGELLPTYERLVAWSEDVGVLAPGEASHLASTQTRAPADAQAALEAAWDLRTVIHDIFAAVASGSAPPESALTSLNRWLADGPAQLALEPSDARFVWRWPGAIDSADGMLAPVAWSAAQLLTSPELDRVSICANDRCGWLFIDSSRRHNRKWCEMGVCGNRAKARRFQQRQREREQRAGGPNR